MHFQKLAMIASIMLGSAVGISQAPPANAPVFLAQPGPWSVGLRVVEQYDHGRSFEAPLNNKTAPINEGRPLQTLIWYPAKAGGSAMKVQDYLELTKTETSFGVPNENATQQGLAGAVSAHAADPMRASRDAPPIEGRYPVVIYSPSFSAVSWENADLCEYLASYGYVVLAAPAMGAQTRESTHDLAGTEAQAKDVSFLITYAESLPDTDKTRVAAMGFSWGGLANLFAASQDNRIRALVSLDGSERYFPGLVKSSGHVHPEQMKIPLLYFEEGDQSLEVQDQLNARFHSEGPNVLNQWDHGDLITAHMLGLFHPAFYSMSYRHESLWQNELPNLQVADYDRNDALLQFSWVMRYARAFADANLKQDTEARKFLESSPTASGIPPHMMSIKLRPAVQVNLSTSGIPSR